MKYSIVEKQISKLVSDKSTDTHQDLIELMKTKEDYRYAGVTDYKGIFKHNHTCHISKAPWTNSRVLTLLNGDLHDCRLYLHDCRISLDKNLKIKYMEFGYSSQKIKDYVSNNIEGKYLSINTLNKLIDLTDGIANQSKNKKAKEEKKSNLKKISYKSKANKIVKAIDENASVHFDGRIYYYLKVDGYKRQYRFKIRKVKEKNDWEAILGSIGSFVPMIKADIYNGRFI